MRRRAFPAARESARLPQGKGAEVRASDCGEAVAVGIIHRLMEACREFGLLVGFAYLASRVVSALSPHMNLFVYEFVVQPVAEGPLATRGRGRIEVRDIRRSDADIALMPAQAHIKDARFAQYSVCLGAYRDGVLIGFIWLNFGSHEEDEVRCTHVLEPFDQSSFDFDVYVFPQYRLGTGFIALWDGANEFLRGRGVRRSFSRITRFNLASRRAHGRLGATVVGRALFLKAWRLECMVATVWPYVSMTLARRVRLRLKASR